MEKAVFAFLARDRDPGEIFTDDGLRRTAESYCERALKTAEFHGLIATPEERRRRWVVTAGVFASVYLVGGTKLFLGLSRGKSIGFLVMMLLAALPVIFLCFSPTSRLTATGKRFLKETSAHFEWMRRTLQQGKEPDVDPGYAFALYGIAAFAGLTMYAGFAEAFPMASSGGCGGGGCGGSGSGCGGGGCSGGCGGCGGGD